MLTALMPWNAPLLWMLRRLRFAMEVDCDARVVRAGADPADYGLALLFVSERQARAPIATMALIERPSQLERRINIMVTSPRRRALVAGACVALAGSCVLAATQMEAPARVDDTPLKLPPSGGPSLRIGQSVERLVRAEYPELLKGEFEGAPVIVVLMNGDFTIAKSAKIVKPDKDALVELTDFAAIGIAEKDVPYTGETWMALPGQTGKGFKAIYTERPAKAGERFVSKLFPDTRALDARIFERYFGDTPRNAVPAGQRPWVLLDRNGQVLRSGRELVGEEFDFRERLVARYPGIRAQEVTVTPVVDGHGAHLKDVAGRDLQLVSVWLAPGSPAPND
jgi:hypothetical protein